MSGARDHLGRPEEVRTAVRPRQGEDHAPAPATAPLMAGGLERRLAQAGPGSGLLGLQRTAGNAAVASLVALPVQRAVTIDEIETDVDAADQGARAAAPDATGDGGSGAVTSTGGTTTITGSAITLAAPITQTDGVIRANTIVAENVVGTNYAPGAGNVW
jgi:hypothetical protein